MIIVTLYILMNLSWVFTEVFQQSAVPHCEGLGESESV